MRSENLFLSGDHHHVMHHDCDHMACACILSITSDFIVWYQDVTGLREDTYELCYNSACLSLAQDDIKEAEEKLKQAEGVKSSDKRWLTLGREYEWEGGGGGWVDCVHCILSSSDSMFVVDINWGRNRTILQPDWTSAITFIPSMPPCPYLPLHQYLDLHPPPIF